MVSPLQELFKVCNSLRAKVSKGKIFLSIFETFARGSNIYFFPIKPFLQLEDNSL